VGVQGHPFGRRLEGAAGSFRVTETQMGEMDVLAEDQILDAAERRFGVPGQGAASQEEQFRPALAALLRALREEARLSPEGRARAAEHLLRGLGARRALDQFEAEAPELSDPELSDPVGPIIITGFQRTGTTLLHNLLARVSGLWAPPLWQLRAPLGPTLDDPTRGAWERDQRGDTAALLDQIFSAAPEFRAIHPMDPAWPDECHWLMRNSFSTLANAFTWFVPSYVRYLSRSDMGAVYADHRRWLRALLLRHPASVHGGAAPRLVLKDPFHLWQLEALLATYPDATVIHLHRDPSEVAPSLASLCATLQAADTDARRCPAEIGAYTLDILDHGLRALERGRASLPAERFIDLSYRELIAAPGSVLRRLGGRLGFDTDASALADADAWLGENRQHKAGKHRYSVDDFGLSDDIMDEYFASYRARFGNLLS